MEDVGAEATRPTTEEAGSSVEIPKHCVAISLEQEDWNKPNAVATAVCLMDSLRRLPR